MNMLIVPEQRCDETMTFVPDCIVALSFQVAREKACYAFADQLTVVLPDLPI